MKWFKKKKDDMKENVSDSVDGFKDFVDQSIREERTEVVHNKRIESRIKSMVQVLADNGFSIEEINSLTASKKIFYKAGNRIEEKG